MSEEITCPMCTMPDLLERPGSSGMTVGFECATCGHEWLAEPSDGLDNVRDANGNLLTTGDDVTVIKDLKTDGKVGGVKAGTKIKGIRLVEGDHEIDGKVNGRALLIRAVFVKKA